tara:strand:- start:1438 stop:2121 length:684 start_codon:yes stop_codon:yes gene_type:complete
MKLSESSLNWRTIHTILKEIWRGKSIARSFMNVSLVNHTLRGNCLDLGSKSSAGSYNRFLKKEDNVKITYTDFECAGDDVVMLDLERPFFIENNKYDTITCFNVLEHIYNYKNVVSESFRIFKKGGQFIGGVPFLVNYHADPHDYFRYTHETIERMFKEVGFKLKQVTFLGYGPITAGVALYLHIFPRIIRSFIVMSALGFDYVILKLKKSQRKRYPLGYTFVFEKI